MQDICGTSSVPRGGDVNRRDAPSCRYQFRTIARILTELSPTILTFRKARIDDTGTSCALCLTNEGQERTMEQPYSVKQNGDHQWVVSAHGKEIMVCKRRSDAVKAAKDAAELLDQPIYCAPVQRSENPSDLLSLAFRRPLGRAR